MKFAFKSIVVAAAFVAAGLLIWQLLSGMTQDAANLYISNAQLVRATPMPLSTFAYSMVARQGLIFLHSAAVVGILLLAIVLRLLLGDGRLTRGLTRFRLLLVGEVENEEKAQHGAGENQIHPLFHGRLIGGDYFLAALEIGRAHV